MPRYTRQAGDAMYRIINVMAEGAPEFMRFPMNDQPLTYNEANQIVEILREDNSKECICGPVATAGSYSIRGNMLLITSNLPAYRLWVRKSSRPEVVYKLPYNPNVENGVRTYKLNGIHAGEIELFLDEYASKLFQISFNP